MLKHIEQFIKGSVQKGYKGTVTDVVLLSLADCHRTTFGKFLSQGKWNINYAWKGIKKFVVRTIVENSSADTPIFAIYNDIISEKTKPSSKAENTIQEASFHQSHLKKKQVYGHQLLTTMLSDGNKILPYSIERYRKGKRWPIEIFFKQTKNNLGLNSYQVRSTKSIDRILILLSLTYIFCTVQENAKDSFAKGLIICRNNVKKDNIQWIYDCAKNNIPIETVLKTMKIA